MQDRDAVAEALLEAPRRLRRERDLGHQHDRARGPRSSAAAGRAQVDLGLAAAGDAVEQQRRSRRALASGARAPRERAALRVGVSAGRRRRRARRPPRRRAAGRRRPRPSLERDEPARREARERGVAAARGARELAPRSAGRRASASSAACWRAPEPRRRRPASASRPAVGERRRRAARACRARRARAPVPGARRQHERQPARGRRAVVLGDPQPEPHQLGRHARLERASGSTSRSGGSSLVAPRARPPRPGSAGGRTARPAREPTPDAGHARSGCGSRTARAARGPWSAARPWRSRGHATRVTDGCQPEQRLRTRRHRPMHGRARAWAATVPPRDRALREAEALPERSAARRTAVSYVSPPPRSSPASSRSASALSVFSHVKSWSSRPKWP